MASEALLLEKAHSMKIIGATPEIFILHRGWRGERKGPIERREREIQIQIRSPVSKPKSMGLINVQIHLREEEEESAVANPLLPGWIRAAFVNS